MKVIRRLEKPTPGLVTYLDCVGDDTDWDEFRSHGSGASYRELRAALTDNQRGLCAYCEMTIRRCTFPVLARWRLPRIRRTCTLRRLYAAVPGGAPPGGV